MPLPHPPLSSLQAAGAAIYAADAELKKAAQEYAEQVRQAMLQNPFDPGNDDLFENWKAIARLARAVTQIEGELRNIYRAATDLSSGSHRVLPTLPTLGSPAPATSDNLEVLHEVEATDVVIKKARKAKKPRKGVVKHRGTAAATKPPRPVRGNTAKLLTHLLDRLSPHESIKLNWSAIAAATGIPVGSISAARIKLLETRHITEDPVGAFKLSSPAE